MLKSLPSFNKPNHVVILDENNEFIAEIHLLHGIFDKQLINLKNPFQIGDIVYKFIGYRTGYYTVIDIFNDSLAVINNSDYYNKRIYDFFWWQFSLVERPTQEAQAALNPSLNAL